MRLTAAAACRPRWGHSFLPHQGCDSGDFDYWWSPLDVWHLGDLERGLSVRFASTTSVEFYAAV